MIEYLQILSDTWDMKFYDYKRQHVLSSASKNGPYNYQNLKGNLYNKTL